MESEASILSACIADRNAYDVVMSLEANADLSPNGVILFKFISEYYKRDKKCQSIDVDVLLSTISAQKPLAYEKLSKVVDNLPEPSPANLITLLTEQRLKRLGAEMTAAFAAGDSAKGSALAAEYHDVYEMGIQTDDEDPLFEVYNDVSIADLTQSLREGANLSLLPDLLGDIVFNMMQGDHVIIFGPVNAGKSAVNIQIAGDYCYDDQVVLYVGNEDPADRMVLRTVCNMVGEPLEEVEEDMDGYTEAAREVGYRNFIFKELAGGTVTDIERLCAKFKPDICIVDQARNLAPAPRKGAFDEAQAEVMYQLRMLYKRMKIVGVSVTQAATTDIKGKPLDFKFKLEQTDVFGSRREVAAQADVMIGIGATEQMKQYGQLYLNVCKNKASGIHDGVMCHIDPFTSSVKSKD
ncbi:hypothetical protein ABMA68_16240 [Halobacteriovorax sp. FRX-2]|uniref:hypothetical protein n=1 Tax=Halobacteriovorax sp. FRX-2 TaxID=3157711 RepID=UPI00371DBB1F